MQGRWEDWVAIAAGTAAVVSWTWHGMLGPPMASVFILGVLTVFSAVLSLTRPAMFASEAVMVPLGVLMFLLPWLLGFTDIPAAAWTAWVLGVVITVVGATGVPLANATHRHAVPH